MALAGPSRLPATDGLPAQSGQSGYTNRDYEHESHWDRATKDGENNDNHSDLGIAGLFEDREFTTQLVGDDSEGHGQADGDQLPVQSDAIARLNDAVERRVELVPSTLWTITSPHPGTNALSRRLTSAFTNIWSKSKSRFFTRTTRECIACTDPILGKDIRAPCGHHYDVGCMTSLFEAACRDESLFPPRCCKRPISFRNVQEHFSNSIRRTFIEKSREFGTAKRVYCARPQCSRFLGPQLEKKDSKASAKTYSCLCGTTTCSQCKHAHGLDACAEVLDEETKVVLELGKQQRWSRCPGCRTMIELNLGCYHMTCLCKVEFCYLCEARWKTCPCTQWDETRLAAAAQERIVLQLEHFEAPRRIAPVMRRWDRERREPMIERPRPIAVRLNHEELLQAVVEELRVNHDCQHTQWRYRDGGGRCGGCYDVLDRYVYHCMGCHTIACNRCRLNRF